PAVSTLNNVSRKRSAVGRRSRPGNDRSRLLRNFPAMTLIVNPAGAPAFVFSPALPAGETKGLLSFARPGSLRGLSRRRQLQPRHLRLPWPHLAGPWRRLKYI